MLDYQTTMKIGQDRYQDVLDRLRDSGMPGVFTQTGGMCAGARAVVKCGIANRSDKTDMSSRSGNSSPKRLATCRD